MFIPFIVASIEFLTGLNEKKPMTKFLQFILDVMESITKYISDGEFNFHHLF